MATYKCLITRCPNQFVDGIPRTKFYCAVHRETDLPTLNHSPDEKIIVTLTDKQIAEICEAFRKQHNDPELGLRPMLLGVVVPPSRQDFLEHLMRIRNILIQYENFDPKASTLEKITEANVAFVKGEI